MNVKAVKAATTAILLRVRDFFSQKTRRRLSYVALLFFVAFVDYACSWRTARTFSYFSILDGKPRIERRYLPRSFSREESLTRYVSELLLGPSDVESGYLFAKGTSVKSVIIRRGIAYIDLSKEAAIPAESRPDVRKPIASAISDIERNFPGLKRAIIYIEGHEPYASDVSLKNGKSVDK